MMQLLLFWMVDMISMDLKTKVLFYIQDGRTALYHSSKNGRLAVVQLLLQKQADTSIANTVESACLFCRL